MNAEETAKELLPCTPNCGDTNLWVPPHEPGCPWEYRPAVAQALWERDEQIVAMKAERDKLRAQLNKCCLERDALKMDLAEQLGACDVLQAELAAMEAARDSAWTNFKDADARVHELTKKVAEIAVLERGKEVR